MASVRWYLTNGVDANGWQALSETAQGAATLTTGGWVVGTGLTNSSEFAASVTGDRASTTFVANTVPDGTLDTTLKDAFRIPSALLGTFASANWTFQFAVVSTIQAGAADGQIVFRLIRAQADGSSPTLITAAQQSASLMSNVGATDINGTLTFNPGAFTLAAGEYLFIQVAWKRTGAGGMTTTNIRLRTGSSATVGTTILSSDFTPATQSVTAPAIASASSLQSAHTIANTQLVTTAPVSTTALVIGPTVVPGDVAVETVALASTLAVFAPPVVFDTTQAVVGPTLTNVSTLNGPTLTQAILAVALYQGTTLITSRAWQVNADWTTTTFDLTTAERDAITDWTALRVWLTADGGQLDVAWVAVDTPVPVPPPPGPPGQEVGGSTRASTAQSFVPTVALVPVQPVTGQTIASTAQRFTPTVVLGAAVFTIGGQTIASSARLIGTGGLLVEHSASLNTAWQHYGSGRGYSQTISGHAGAVGAIALRMYRGGTLSDGMYLVIRDAFNGTVLDTSLVVPGSVITAIANPGTWVTFPLLKGVLLQAANTYWIEQYLTRLTSDAANYWMWEASSSADMYAGGAAFNSSGTSLGSNYDFCFRLYVGSSHTVDVPSAYQYVTGAHRPSTATLTAPSSLTRVVAVPHISSSVADSYLSTATTGTGNSTSFWGQSFFGNGKPLVALRFLLRPDNTTGSISAALYPAEGQHGTTARPVTNSVPLAVSESISPVAGTKVWHTFAFTGPNRVVLTAGTLYIAVYNRKSDLTNTASIELLLSGGTHAGNTSESYTGLSWGADTYFDAPFQVDTDPLQLFPPLIGEYITAPIASTAQVFAPSFLVEPQVTVAHIASTVMASLTGGADSKWAGYHALGASFYATTSLLTGMRFRLHRDSDDTSVLTARLYLAGSVGGENEIPVGEPLAVSDVVPLSAFPLTTFSWVPFAFTGANRVTLHAGVQYVAVVWLTAPTTNQMVGATAENDHGPYVPSFSVMNVLTPPNWYTPSDSHNYCLQFEVLVDRLLPPTVGELIATFIGPTAQVFTPSPWYDLPVGGAFIEANLSDYSWLTQFPAIEPPWTEWLAGETDDWGTYLGQEFTVGSRELLTAIDLRALRSGTPTDNVFVEIREGGRDGAVIATSTHVSGSTLPSDDFSEASVFLTLPFPSPVVLNPGTLYAWIAKRDGVGSWDDVVILTMDSASTSQYPNRIDVAHFALVWDGSDVPPQWYTGYDEPTTGGFQYRLKYAVGVFAPPYVSMPTALVGATIASTAIVIGPVPQKVLDLHGFTGDPSVLFANQGSTGFSQSVTGLSGPVDRVGFQLLYLTNAVPGGDVFVRLRATSPFGTILADSMSVPIIGTVPVMPDGTAPVPPTYFSFPTHPVLASGTTYVFQLVRTSSPSGSNENMGVRADSANPYAGGMAFSTGGSPQAAYDLFIDVWLFGGVTLLAPVNEVYAQFIPVRSTAFRPANVFNFSQTPLAIPSATIIGRHTVGRFSNQGLSSTTPQWGQSFLGDGRTLGELSFWLSKVFSPTGNARAHVYATTGTHGVDAVPTGSPLATSTTLLNVTTLTSSFIETTFQFTNGPLLVAGVTYMAVLEGPNNLSFDRDLDMGHIGNSASLSSGTWTSVGGPGGANATDMRFTARANLPAPSVELQDKSVTAAFRASTAQVFTPSLSYVQPVGGAFIEADLSNYSWLTQFPAVDVGNREFLGGDPDDWGTYLGQEFTVGNAKRLTAIDLRLEHDGSFYPTDNIYVEIRVGGRNGSVIGTSALVAASGAPETPFTFVPVPFPTPVDLTPGTPYAWVAKRDGEPDIALNFYIDKRGNAGEVPGRINPRYGALVWDGSAAPPDWYDYNIPDASGSGSFEFRLHYAVGLFPPIVLSADIVAQTILGATISGEGGDLLLEDSSGVLLEDGFDLLVETRTGLAQVFAPTVAMSVDGATRLSTAQMFTASVTTGPVSVGGSTLAPASLVFASTVAVGAVTVDGATRASTSAVSAPAIAVVALGATIPSASGLFPPQMVALTLTTATRSTTIVLSTPTVGLPIALVTVGTVGAVSQGFAPAIAPGPVLVDGATRLSTAQVFVATISVGPVTVGGATMLTTVVLQAATITAGGITVTGGTVTGTPQAFTPSVTVGAVTVGGATRGTTLQVFAPVLTALATGATIVSGSGTFAPTLTQNVTTAALGPGSQVFLPVVAAAGVTAVGGGTVASGSVLQLPSITTGPVAVGGSTLASASQTFVPTLAVGPVTILGTTRGSTSQTFVLSVAVGPVTVVGATVSTTALLFVPALTQVAAGAIGAATIPTSVLVNAPTVVGGLAIIGGATLAATSTTTAPSVTVGPATVFGTTLASGALLFPATVLPQAVAVTGGTQPTTSVAFAPSLAVGAVAVTTGTRGTTLQLFAPVLTALATGATIVSGSGTFAPSVALTVTTATQPATSQVFVPALTLGGVTVGGVTLGPAAQGFPPIVTVGPVTVGGQFRAPASLLSPPAVTTLTAITTAALGSTAGLFAPTVLPIGAIGGPTTDSTVQLFGVSVTTGPVAVAAGTRASTLQVFIPTVGVGATPVTGATIGSTALVFAPTAVARLDGTFIASTTTLFAPTVQITQFVTTALIPVGAAPFAPSVLALWAVTGATRLSTTQTFAPSITTGAVTVIGSTVPAAGLLFAPALLPGAVTVAAAHRTSTLLVLAPSVAVTVEMAHRASTVALFPPALAVGPVAVVGGTILSTVQTFPPSLGAGITTAFLASTTLPFAPTLAPLVTTPLWHVTTELFPPSALPLGELLGPHLPSGSQVFPPFMVAYAVPPEILDFESTIVREFVGDVIVCREQEGTVILTREAEVVASVERGIEMTSRILSERVFSVGVER